MKDEYPQLDVEFIQVLQDMIGDLTSSPEPIEIKLFAPDPKLLKKWAPKVAEKIKKIEGRGPMWKTGSKTPSAAPAMSMNVDPVVAARARDSRRRKSNWMPVRFCRVSQRRLPW